MTHWQKLCLCTNVKSSLSQVSPPPWIVCMNNMTHDDHANRFKCTQLNCSAPQLKCFPIEVPPNWSAPQLKYTPSWSAPQLKCTPSWSAPQLKCTTIEVPPQLKCTPIEVYFVVMLMNIVFAVFLRSFWRSSRSSLGTCRTLSSWIVVWYPPQLELWGPAWHLVSIIGLS